MLWQVEIRQRRPESSHAARGVTEAARALGIEGCVRAEASVGWLVEGDLSRDDIERVAADLLCDPVSESWSVSGIGGPASGVAQPGDPADAGLPVVLHVLPRTGVTDPAGESAREAMRLLGFEARAVRSLRTYRLPPLSPEAIDRLAWKALASEAVHEVVTGPLAPRSLAGGGRWVFENRSVRLEGLDAEALARLSRERCLALSVEELSAVAAHFAGIGRDPTEIELESIAQTWSEHCCHKTLTSAVDHEGPRGSVSFDNLLKETVFAATRSIRERLGERDWCVSVFRDNSGVIRFDDEHDICVKVETHNHPSAIEPYGGAATGLGGVIRDVLGTGLSARPVANLDVFCVAPPDFPADRLPPGVIHPRRLLDGVVAGVRDYGNRMGIPTIAGAVAFDEGYLGNPLVYCGTVGIMPRDSADARVAVGDLVVVAGGRTGRDGIHGATFSSIELSSASETESGGAVQIGHAIHEKTLLEFVVEAGRQRLFSAITDCGAGGLSSAVGEMGADLGAEVDLDAVPLKYDGLSATEVWISEAQERMVLAVPPANWERLRTIAETEGVEASVIGRFTGTGRLRLRWDAATVGDLDCRFLHGGRPGSRRTSRWIPSRTNGPGEPARSAATPADLHLLPTLRRLLARPDIASKEWIIRQYDHEVQGTSVVKPLVGPGDGPSDATVIRGALGRPAGIVLGVGLRHRLGRLDPYQMAAAGIVEAIANVVASGAGFDRIALLDNFCFGECRSPEGLGAAVEACLACHDMALAFDAPFVSGKDSLNNVFTWSDGEGRCRELSIPPTLLATAVGRIADVSRAMTTDLKRLGNRLYVVGATTAALAGSQVAAIWTRAETGPPPVVDAAACRRVFEAVARAIADGLVAACHDCSDGGLLTALGEMAIGGGLGCRVDLAAVPLTARGPEDHETRAADAAIGPDVRGWPPGWVAAFAETPGRFICEVPPEAADAFEAACAGIPHAAIGEVTPAPTLTLDGEPDDHGPREIAIDALAAAWRSLADDFSGGCR
jgi:phosphoribosylformylglycinamidine synthase II